MLDKLKSKDSQVDSLTKEIEALKIDLAKVNEHLNSQRKKMNSYKEKEDTFSKIHSVDESENLLQSRRNTKNVQNEMFRLKELDS